MRIIAGELRGRRIEAPPGLGTRPMLDRVREALFSTLGERIDDALVLDLFAGSGSLGLEALSRGARRAALVESDTSALRTLQRNVDALGLADRVDVVRGDAQSLPLEALTGGERAGVVFLDPPYDMVRDSRLRPQVAERAAELAREVLDEYGVVVLHVPRREVRAFVWPADLRVVERSYGTSSLLYVAPARAEAGDGDVGDGEEDAGAEEDDA